jgi:hypothetical protein
MVTNRFPATGVNARRVLWCMVCGDTRAATADDFLHYTRDGWPRCCNAVMSYFTEMASKATLGPDTELVIEVPTDTHEPLRG